MGVGQNPLSQHAAWVLFVVVTTIIILFKQGVECQSTKFLVAQEHRCDDASNNPNHPTSLGIRSFFFHSFGGGTKKKNYFILGEDGDSVISNSRNGKETTLKLGQCKPVQQTVGGKVAVAQQWELVCYDKITQRQQSQKQQNATEPATFSLVSYGPKCRYPKFAEHVDKYNVCHHSAFTSCKRAPIGSTRCFMGDIDLMRGIFVNQPALKFYNCYALSTELLQNRDRIVVKIKPYPTINIEGATVLLTHASRPCEDLPKDIDVSKTAVITSKNQVQKSTGEILVGLPREDQPLELFDACIKLPGEDRFSSLNANKVVSSKGALTFSTPGQRSGAQKSCTFNITTVGLAIVMVLTIGLMGQ